MDEVANNYISKLRSFKFPQVLKFINSAELPHVIYLVTEPVVPLDIAAIIAKADEDAKAIVEKDDGSSSPAFAAASGSRPPLSEFAIQSLSLGLFQIATAVSFLNDKAHHMHGNICPSSIFVTKAGDWKLGGLELCFKLDTSGSEASADAVPSFVRSNSTLLPAVYRSPEWSSAKWKDIAGA